jgi:poly(A) polymerase
VFGTPEQDARRRDFTINGLFYDVQTKQVIDHVEGLPDLEARIVRTIGDPDIRFREDPIRILRAVKFAARCNLTIEPETYRRMMEHREEIAKCAQSRVSEEFYRLLRAGAAKRSMELLVETELLDLLAPDVARGLRGEPPGADAALQRARLWGYLGALDRSTDRRPVPPSNALILAVLLLPRLRDALDPDSNGVRDVGRLVSEAIAPALERLRPSRRDSEFARQILLALRSILVSRNPRRKRPRLAAREYLDEALRLAEIVSDAEAIEPALAGRPILAEGTVLGEGPEEPDDALPAELELPPDTYPDRDRDRDRRHGRGRGRGPGGPPPPPRAPAPAPALPALVMDLGTLATAVRSLIGPPLRPAFFGTGTFGGPWNRDD